MKRYSHCSHQAIHRMNPHLLQQI